MAIIHTSTKPEFNVPAFDAAPKGCPCGPVNPTNPYPRC